MARRATPPSDDSDDDVYHPTKLNGVNSGQYVHPRQPYQKTPTKLRVAKAKKALNPNKGVGMTELKSEYSEALAILKDVVERMQEKGEQAGLSPMIEKYKDDQTNANPGLVDDASGNGLSDPLASLVPRESPMKSPAKDKFLFPPEDDPAEDEMPPDNTTTNPNDGPDANLDGDKVEGNAEEVYSEEEEEEMMPTTTATTTTTSNPAPAEPSFGADSNNTLSDYNSWWRAQQDLPGAVKPPEIELGGLGAVSPVKNGFNLYGEEEVAMSPAEMREEMKRMRSIIDQQEDKIQVLSTEKSVTRPRAPEDKSPFNSPIRATLLDSGSPGKYSGPNVHRTNSMAFVDPGPAARPAETSPKQEPTNAGDVDITSIRRKSRFAVDETGHIPEPATNSSPDLSEPRKSSISFGGGEDDLRRKSGIMKEAPIKWAKVDLDADDDEDESELAYEEEEYEEQKVAEEVVEEREEVAGIRRKSRFAVDETGHIPEPATNSNPDLSQPRKSSISFGGGEDDLRRKSSIMKEAPIKWVKVDLDADDDEDEEEEYENDAEAVEGEAEEVAEAAVEEQKPSFEVPMPPASALPENSEMSELFGKIDAVTIEPKEPEEEVAKVVADEAIEPPSSCTSPESGSRGLRSSFLARVGDADDRTADIDYFMETGEEKADVDETYQTTYETEDQKKERLEKQREMLEEAEEEKETEEEKEAEPAKPVVPPLALPDPEVADLEESMDDVEPEKTPSPEKAQSPEKAPTPDPKPDLVVPAAAPSPTPSPTPSPAHLPTPVPEPEFDDLEESVDAGVVPAAAPSPAPSPAQPSSSKLSASPVPEPEFDDLEESVDAGVVPAAAPSPAPSPAQPSPVKLPSPQSSPLKNAEEVDEVGSDDEIVMTDRSEGLGGRIYLPDGTYKSTTTNVDREIEKLTTNDITSPGVGGEEVPDDLEQSYESDASFENDCEEEEEELPPRGARKTISVPPMKL